MKEQNKISIGIVQHACTGELEVNIQKSLQGIKACKEQGADLVVLQELHTSLYFCQAEEVEHFDLAEPIPGAISHRFAKAAKENEMVIIASLFEKRAPGLCHNTAVVFEKDGSIVGKYRKMHIPDDPAYYEKFYFTPGDLGFQPIQTSIGKLGVLVCWDQWFPEAARLMALAGAEVLIYPTAIGWESTDDDLEKKRQFEAWQTIQRSHAIANGIPVIVVNRIGFEEDWTGVTNGIEFWGQSFVAGPQGEILYHASVDQEEKKAILIDRNRTEAVRRIWPFLRDRRIDAYQGLLERFID